MSFADDLARFEQKANANIGTVVRKVAIGMADSLIQMSPVDTGRFKANWVASVGRIDRSTSGATDKGGAGTLGAITQAVSSVFGPNRLRYDFESAIWITNSLPYAQRLEYGWSKQAPAGMVRLTVARFESFVSAAAVGLK